MKQYSLYPGHVNMHKFTIDIPLSIEDQLCFNGTVILDYYLEMLDNYVIPGLQYVCDEILREIIFQHVGVQHCLRFPQHNFPKQNN